MQVPAVPYPTRRRILSGTEGSWPQNAWQTTMCEMGLFSLSSLRTPSDPADCRCAHVDRDVTARHLPWNRSRVIVLRPPGLPRPISRPLTPRELLCCRRHGLGEERVERAIRSPIQGSTPWFSWPQRNVGNHLDRGFDPPLLSDDGVCLPRIRRGRLSDGRLLTLMVLAFAMRPLLMTLKMTYPINTGRAFPPFP